MRKSKMDEMIWPVVGNEDEEHVPASGHLYEHTQVTGL